MYEKLQAAIEAANRHYVAGQLATSKTINRTISVTRYVWGRFNASTLCVDVTDVDVVPLGYRPTEKAARATELDAICIQEETVEIGYSLTVDAFITYSAAVENLAEASAEDAEGGKNNDLA